MNPVPPDPTAAEVALLVIGFFGLTMLLMIFLAIGEMRSVVQGKRCRDCGRRLPCVCEEDSIRE